MPLRRNAKNYVVEPLVDPGVNKVPYFYHDVHE